jgi:hypothetical protein
MNYPLLYSPQLADATGLGFATQEQTHLETAKKASLGTPAVAKGESNG